VNGSDKAIGLDVGGTKTTVAAVDASGRVQARVSFETNSGRGFAICLVELVKRIRNVLNAADWTADKLSGIGIGCAGPVNPRRGTIHNPYTLPGWDGADIVTPLREGFGVSVCLENDADAATLGEFHFGAGRGANPLVVVTLGTGVGGGVLVNGQIYRGVNGEHPELGHISVLPDGPECYCGTRGCWESLASGSAIASAGETAGFKDSRSVFAAAPTDSNASVIIQRALSATATGAWALFHTFLPQRIILGGGIGEEHFDIFATTMRQQISRATQFSKDRVEIVRAKLGNDAGVIGAACLAFQNSKST
jgi:glucokinase